LREFLEAIESIGQLRRIDAEVSRDEEMGAITYLYHQKPGAPALMFESIGGCPPGFRALWNQLGSSSERLALAMGEAPQSTTRELIDHFRRRMNSRITPVTVDAAKAPVNANHMRGQDVDITIFPAARHWPLDGGEYIGTCDAIITRDPDQGWLNVGCYRQMVQSRNEVGLYVSSGRDARLHIERSWAKGQAAEVVCCWGIDPVLYMSAGLTFPKTESELDFAGGLRGRAIELVEGEATSIPYPANVEIVAEGVIQPGSFRPEGPFGEFTGYYGRATKTAYLVEIKAVHFRDNPILTQSLMADYPANEQAFWFSVCRSGRIWADLDKVGVPGIAGVYCHPAAIGGTGITAVSLEQRYAGHAAQTLALAAQTPAGAGNSKWVVAVDEDVDPTDINQVLWAMTTRCHPVDDIDMMRTTWGTELDPSQEPPEKRVYGSKALINACKNYRFAKTFSKRTALSNKTFGSVAGRWSELGLEGVAPRPPTLDDESASLG
jgi:4-hydroxy-3-polyprenylbenzoate decarboxylase